MRQQHSCFGDLGFSCNLNYPVIPSPCTCAVVRPGTSFPLPKRLNFFGCFVRRICAPFDSCTFADTRHSMHIDIWSLRVILCNNREISVLSVKTFQCYFVKCWYMLKYSASGEGCSERWAVLGPKRWDFFTFRLSGRFCRIPRQALLYNMGNVQNEENTKKSIQVTKY